MLILQASHPHQPLLSKLSLEPPAAGNTCLCACVLLQDGRTPLHLSAGQGHVAVIRDLLRKGADPLRRDMVGANMTPLCAHVVCQ